MRQKPLTAADVQNRRSRLRLELHPVQGFRFAVRLLLKKVFASSLTKSSSPDPWKRLIPLVS
jgi:hypothetical protein